MSPPDFDLFPKSKEPMRRRRYLLWKRFISPYPNHSTDEQKWCPRWNNKASETLGFSYTEAGRLY
ncbi:hypothetical protein C0J52_20568 [Blattella germanica]|nr:hypothetical protein C0J52_20568 [Blattella germanica]